MSMDDILDRCSRDDHQLHGPEIKTQVLDIDHPLVEAVERLEMLHEEGQSHRQDQDDTHLVEDAEEGGKKGDVGRRLLDEREANWNEDRTEEIGEKAIGGDFLQSSSEFGGHYGCCRGTRRDNASQDRLYKRQFVALQAEEENGANQDPHEGHLKKTHTVVPLHRHEFSEIHFAESDKEHQKHKERQDGVEECTQGWRDPVESRNEGKQQVKRRSQKHRQRQSPVFDKSE